MTIKNKRIHNTGRLTDSKKRSFGIFTGLALAISAAILIFSGCEVANDSVTNTDLAAVNAAISKLDYTSITFEDTEDQDKVRSDFTLPLSGELGTAISWTSSNTDMLSIDQATAAVGSLKTGEASIKISLSATVSKGSAKQSKTFNITILANANETPGVPSSLSINKWTADSLELEWTNALPGRVNGEAGRIEGYTVYYSTSDDFLDLTGLKSADQSIDFGSSTRAEVTGLESGTQYYFAVTAINAYKEGPVSPSLETHTNTPADFVMEAPAIIGRSAGNRQVELTWTAPAATGWKNGQAIAISGYKIYQNNAAIRDTAGLTTVVTGIEPVMRTWSVSGLVNGKDYYFAVSALTGEGVESLPGGGDISVTPKENISTIRDILSLSVEDFAALTGTSGQAISVDITASGLTYGTDYMISISKAGSSVEALVYNPETQEIDIADTIGPADAGSYTIRASGMGLYNEAVTDDFELTVKLSNTNLLEQALKALSYTDIKFAADEDENSVHSDFTVPQTGLHGSSIDWKSDNPVVMISGNAAAVDPPDENTVVVTLTANLYLNAEHASKEFIIVLTHPPNTLPGAPENLAFTSWDTEAIGLSWSADDSGYVDGDKASISDYTIYYSETGDFSDLAALKNAEQYVEISAAADSEAETTAIISSLRSGVLYYFALSAANSSGEGPLSASMETHTNSSPGAPVVIGRSAANQAVVLTWAAPAMTGWTDGHEGIISSYAIYQDASAISDLSGLTAIGTVSNVNPAGLQTYTATGLDNGSDYYFAVAAVTASGQSLPGGGDVSVSPGTTTDLGTVITLSVEDAAASSTTPDQHIAVSLVDGGLSYGQDYSITIIKGGRATTALSWDAAEKTIMVSPALSESDASAYSIIASGMGAYGGNVSDPFTLTVNLSDTDAVAAAQAALDISTEAGGDLNAVTVSHIALPIDGRYDTVISWESSDEKVIRTDGTVIIPAVGSPDAEVTLTATISKNTANAQKTFNLIVKAPVDVKNTLPGEPTDLALSAWTDTSIELSWTAPDPGYVGGVPGSIRSYRIYYSENDDFSNLTGLDSSTGGRSPLTISNLSSGTLYYFAVSASNANGEGPVSPSVSTRTNSAPGTPGIAARIAGDGQVGLNWQAPALSGWKDGQAAVIEHYEIYQSDTPISDISGMTAVYTTASAAEKSYTLTRLNNGQDYYFAVVAVTVSGKSAPGGGNAAVRPSDAITGLDTTPFALSIAPASIYTNSPGQFISVTLNEGGLIYGQDYTISISKGGASTTLLAWNTTDGRIDVIETVTEVGADIWTVTASGMGTYSGIVEVDFELEVLLSDAEAVAAAAAALDIGEAVGGDVNAVRDGFTLPLKGIEGTGITWQSTDANIIIAPDGTVTVDRPAAGDADAPVILQATISKGIEQKNKDFVLTIKAHPDTGNAANTAPGEPFGLMFSTWTENSIKLSWSAPDAGKEGGNPGTISGYTVYYNSNNDFADLAALAGQSIDTGNTTATVDGLTSGQQYYFAVSAVNAHGESSISQSKTTRTNAAPGTPLISARNAGDGQVEIVWTAAQSAGWINGTAAAIVNYEIYQSNSVIADLTGQTAIHHSSALARAYTIDALTNGESYYFAVAAVSNINGRSTPGGGDIPVTPNDNLISLTSTQFALSIDNAAALTNTAGQMIAVNLNEDNLVYGQDYRITLSKGGAVSTELAWNSANRQLDIVTVLSTVGTEHYTLTASGTGAYSGIIERSFELQISLSAADAVAAAKAALDIREAAGGDLNAVTVSEIALPLSGINGTNIEWTSNNPNVISANGAVSRPAVGAFDSTVILKAAIRKDGEAAEKSFTLTVKAQKPSGPSTVPDAIGSIVLSEWSESSVRLDWTEAHPGLIDGKRASISAYTVYYNTSDDFSDLETLTNRTVDAGTELYAVIDGLESGKLYYFAVTASNTVGESPVSQSVSTRTNSLPDRPLITGQRPGNKEIQLSWLAPASAGWKDGTQTSIVEYRIYQAVHPIDNVDQLSPVGSAQDMHYTVTSLSNDQTYYFAVTAVNGHGEESLPAGGEAALSPTVIAAISIQGRKFSLSVENAAAWTNTAGQTIDIDLDEDSLIYGQDYSIVISKAGNEAQELYYDSGIGKIRVSDALAASLVGDRVYTVTAHGMGGYKDSVTDDFVLAVSLSDADAVAADKRTLDISQEAGGNLNAVVIEHINLPANGPKGSAITWFSSNPAVIAGDGAVARPLIGTADAVVELTASIRKNSASVTRKFTLKVLALTGIANTAPGAPEDLQATPGELKITLSWIAPEDRGSVRGQSASSLTYSVSGHETQNPTQSIPGIGSIRGTVVEVENLKANTEYSFYVRASNSGTQSAPATINATALETSNQIEISSVSYTPNSLEPMAGQTIEAISPALSPDTVKTDDPRLGFAISPTDFETQTGLDFDESTGRISGTASLTAMTDAVSYTISVVPDTGYYTGTPDTVISIQVQPILTAAWNAITATAFTPGVFGSPSLDSTEWTGSFSAVLPGGLDINPITGEISGEPDGAYDAADYTVELTGRDDYFGVDSSAKISIEVAPKELGDTDFSITDLSHTVIALTGGQHRVIVNGGLTHTDDYTLSISPDVNGNIRIDNAGTISIGAGITVSDTRDYTITATGQNDYSGTVERTFTLTVNSRTLTSAMLGSISTTDFTIKAGFANAETRTLNFDASLTVGTDYTIAITGRPPDAKPDHLSLDAATGVLTLSTAIAPDDSGVYTLTVSAAGNYTDPATPLTAAFRLTVTKADILSITYSPVTAVFKTAMAQSADPAIEPADAAAGASFTISPELHTNTGLSFDPATGAISGTPTIRASGNYSVRIEGGDGTKYEGTTLTSASFSVSIDPKAIEGTLSYDGSSIDTTYGTGQALSIQWDKALPEQTVSYAIAPADPADPALPDDILFTTGTGALSVSNLTAVHTGTYTVTASGTGNYTGTKSVDVNIKIDPKALETADFSVQNTVTVTALTANEIPDVVTSSITAGTDYTLDITAWPGTANDDVVSIDNDGKVSTTEVITIAAAGSYTVTASGNGNYSGTATGTFTLTVNPKELTSALLGSISTTNFTIKAGFANAETRTLNFDGSLTVGTDYTLAITGRPLDAVPDHLSLDAATAVLTLSTDIVPDDSGEYTLTVSAAGSYTDPANPLSAAFRLTVTKADITSLTYSPVTAIFKTAMAQSADPTIEPADAATGARFTISPDLNADTGLSFDPATGAISGTPTIRASGDYSVSIEGGDGTKYEGSTLTSASFSVSIDPKPIEGTLSYIGGNIVTTYGTVQALSIQWTDDLPEQTVSYAIAPKNSADPALPDDILFTTSTGALSVSNKTAVHTGTYTVTASGSGDYGGTKTVTVNIKIEPKALETADFTVQNTVTVTALTANEIPDVMTSSLAAGTDYSLDISSRPNTPNAAVLSIDSDGKVSTTEAISMADNSGSYTVTASGNGNYSGTATGTFTLTVNPKELTSALLGSISTTDFTIKAGFANAETRTLNFDASLTVGTDYTIAITGRPPDAVPEHLSLDAATGVLTLSTAIAPDDSGEYTLTVSAAGNYKDPANPLTAAFTLTVTKADIRSITYSPVTAIFKTAMTQSAGPTIEPADAAAGARFTISPDLNADTGLNFDPATGAISGTPTTRASGDYSVRIEGGDGTKYEGSTLTSGLFRVNIDPKPIEGTLSYTGGSNGNIATTYGTAQALSIQWIGDLPEQTVTYAIAPANSADPELPDDITFTTTGALSVSNLTAVHTGTYTVTASGTGDYGGSKTVDVNIKIDPKALETADFSVQNTVEVTALTANEISDVMTSSLSAGTDYSLDITSRPNTANAAAVSIDNDGKVSTTEAISMADNSGSYTVTASGNGNYSGTATGTFTLTVNPRELTSALLGSISTTDFTIKAGFANAETRTLNFDASLTVGSDFTLAITGRPQDATASHVSLNSDTGELTSTPDIVPDDSGEYTLTVSAKGNYTNPATPLTATFTLTITKADIRSITYSPVTAIFKTAMAQSASPTIEPADAAAGARFTISPDLNADTGLSFDPDTGSISGTPTIRASGDYSVSIEGGDGTKYEGSTLTSASFSVSIDPKPIEGTLSYDGSSIATTYGTAQALSVQWTGDLPEQTVTYAIAPAISADSPLPNDIIFTTSTGALSVSNKTAVHTGTYTVTASGSGDYTGTKTVNVNIKIEPKALETADFSVQNDVTVTAFTANEIPDVVTSSLSAGTDYTLDITNRPGTTNAAAVSIDNNGKVSTTEAISMADNSGSYTVRASGNGNYSGTAEASFKITVKIGISGTLSYADLEIAAGQTKRSNASWNNAASGQTVRYTLLNPPAGISIDETIGVVTVDAAVVTADTSCGIRAEGIGNYTGETTAELKVFIRDWIPPELTLTYADIRVYKGGSASSLPQWSSGGHTAVYEIAPLSGGTLPDEISIDPSSGDISVSSSAALQADTVYQVTATGTGSWKGWKTAEIRISVYDTFSYEFKPALVGQEFTLPAINASSFGQFAVSPSLPNGLILSDTGVISGTPTTRQLAAEYTITAAPTGGGSAISNKVYLFIQERAANKHDLWRMIDEEIAAQGNTADLGLIDTSIITDMFGLFYPASRAHADYSAFNGDISGWDVSSVTNMGQMFDRAAAFNGDLSGWDVSSVTSMGGMFRDTESFNGDLSGWDVSSVTYMGSMFNGAEAFNGDLSGWDVSSVWYMRSMFNGATNFNGDLSGWDVSSVTYMGFMFNGAEAFNGDLSGWDVSSVTDMSAMFSGAAAFNGDLSGWDVSSVTSTSGMFNGATNFNGDLSGWDVSSVRGMSSMFDGATNFNGDLSGWDVSSVWYMDDMFSGAAAFNGDLSGWDVSSVTDMRYMFSGAEAFNGDLSGWDVSSVTSMYWMFREAAAFNGDLSGWDVSSVTDMRYMFSGAEAFNGDLSGWDVSSVTSMHWMFREAAAFNGDLSGWDVSSVTSMSSMFSDAAAFNGNLSGWDVSSVTNMYQMFQDATAFNGDISGWDVSSVTDMGTMFYKAKAFNGDISGWDVSSVTNMRYMFYNAKAFNGDLSGWDVSSVTNMEGMFRDAAAFNGDLSGWDVSSVTDMRSMFSGAAAFNGDLSGWDVSSVRGMSSMFDGATNFNRDLSGWNVSSVTYMGGMFRDTESFNGDLSGWDVSSVTYMRYMFYNAEAFNGDLSGWDVSSVTYMSYMFYEATNFNGDLSGWDVSSVTDMRYMFYNAEAFNGDLESWRANLGTNVSMDEMFSGSGLANNPPSWY